MIRRHGGESEQCPSGLGHGIPRPLVVGLQDVHELSQDQVREDQFVLSCGEKKAEANFLAGDKTVFDPAAAFQDHGHGEQEIAELIAVFGRG